MEFSFESQPHLGKTNMVSDTLSRLLLADIHDANSNEKIVECYVELLTVIFVTAEHIDMNDNAKSETRDDPPRAPKCDILLELRNCMLCQEYRKKLDKTRSSYILAQSGIPSR